MNPDLTKHLSKYIYFIILKIYIIIIIDSIYEFGIQSLITQLAPPSQAHSILIDLCRTFPKHRQFRESLAQSTGQKSLYNVLKAYCLLDTEVGYCQGLSFVVGLILIYLPDEEDAFKGTVLFDIDYVTRIKSYDSVYENYMKYFLLT